MDRYGCNGDGRRIDGRALVRGNGDGDSGLYMEEEEPLEEEEEDDDDDEEYEEDEDEEEEEDEEMYGKEDGYGQENGDEAGIGEGNVRTREGEEEDSSDSGGIAPPSTKIRKRGGLSAVELELGVKVAASRVSRGFGAMAADSRVSRDFGSSALEMGVTTAAAARVSKDFAGSELGAMATSARLSRDSGASERGGMAGSSRVSRDFGDSELAAMAADSRVSVHGLVNEHVEEWGLRVPDEFGDVNFVPDERKSGEGMALEENPPPPPKRKPPAPDSNGTTAAKKPKKKTVNVWAKSSTSRKSGKKGNNKGNGAQRSSLANGSVGDAAYLVPLYKNPEKLDDDPKLPILLSRIYRGEKAELSADRLSVGSTKGYRMVRATRGVSEGAWYFEVSIDHLGPTGHTRLGWSTMKGDLQAPVGFDRHSYAYRDVDGSKVHMALREPYACPYFEGDVIGFYIGLPNGAALAPKGYPWFHESKDDQIPTVPGSEILFFHNGVCQGTAYTDITAGRYYPAASMYTLPNQPNCTVSFNFGPSFKFPPLDIGDRLKPEPMSKAPYLSLDGKEMPPMSNGESFGEDQVTKPHNIGESRGFA